MVTTRRVRNALLLVTTMAGGSLVAQPLLNAARTPGPAAEMSHAAQALLAGLSADQRARATFKMDDPLRVQWYFVPRDRPGVSIKQMDAQQRELAHALLKTGLSATGYHKTTSIMSLEQVLAEMEKDPVRRDPEKYHFSIFGTPDPKGTWGWKVEGHHVSMHFTVVKGTLIASAPAFLGSNPGEVRQGPRKGLRVLGAEEDAGRKLITALDERQRARAIFDAVAPHEVITGNASKVDPLAPVGLPVKEFTAPQRALVEDLLALYASNLPSPLAEQRMARIRKAGIDAIRFGWAGGIQPGQPHYYRLQGPTFVIEYDDTQNEANHIHTVFRDFEDDFGRDLLREHRQASHARP